MSSGVLRSSRSRLRWQNCVLIIRDLFHPLNHLTVKASWIAMCVMATVALAPAAPVTSATLLSNDRFIVIPLSAGGLASHSSPAFAHLYHARPGRNVKIACPAKPWKSRHLSTNSSAATVRPQLPASSRLRRRSEPRRCRSTGAPEGCHSPPDGAQPEPP